ncbi:MAG TPA: ester cyclase [Chitinophagaceae bacterium]|nr:ester cyclase [Chitinophagaceae bacterium]
MKKNLLSIAGFAFLFLITSCDNDKEEHGMSEKAEKNLAAQHGIIKCFDTKDFSMLGDFVAEDFIDHAGQNGEIKGLANAKAEFENMVKTLNDNKSEIILELANDEYVMSWIRFTGTLATDNPGMGMKAGDKYDMKSMELSKFKDGKAIEHWVFMDPAEMMKMMSSMTPPPAVAKDSAVTK